MRHSVTRFAEIMEQRLKENEHKGGWKGESVFFLLTRAQQEFSELMRSILDEDLEEDVTREAADVANFCMMIADNAGGLE